MESHRRRCWSMNRHGRKECLFVGQHDLEDILIIYSLIFIEWMRACVYLCIQDKGQLWSSFLKPHELCCCCCCCWESLSLGLVTWNLWLTKLTRLGWLDRALQGSIWLCLPRSCIKACYSACLSLTWVPGSTTQTELSPPTFRGHCQ